MYEQGGESSKKVAELPKGTALYIETKDKTMTDGTWIAATTTDNKYSGYVKISALDEVYTPDGQPVAVISGLCNNGYDSIAGLGEAATVAASVTAASSTILGICLKLKNFYENVKGVVEFGQELKEDFSPADNDSDEGGDGEQPTPAPSSSQSQQQQPSYSPEYPMPGNGQQNWSQGEQQMQTAKPKQQESQQSGINKKTLIIGGAAVVGLGLLAFAFRGRNNNQSNN